MFQIFLMTASHALSQLSYDPEFQWKTENAKLTINHFAKTEVIAISRVKSSRRDFIFHLTSLSFKDRLAFFQKCRDAFFFVFG